MPVFPEKLNDLMKEVCAEWNDAEKAIKRAEQLVGDAVIPAIKELRYSGRRIIEATNLITTDGPEDRIDHLLRDALFNCHRAQHDAIDASVATINVHIDRIQRRVSDKVIIDVFDDYPELLAARDAVHEQVAEARENRESRDAIYDSIRRIEFTRLEKVYKKFRSSESVMRRRTVRGRWAALGGWIIAGFTIITGFAATYFGYIDFSSS